MSSAPIGESVPPPLPVPALTLPAVHGVELSPATSERLLMVLLQFVDERRNVGVALEAIRCIAHVGWHAVLHIRTALATMVSRLQVWVDVGESVCVCIFACVSAPVRLG